jgi:hypothetical protein
MFSNFIVKLFWYVHISSENKCFLLLETEYLTLERHI